MRNLNPQTDRERWTVIESDVMWRRLIWPRCERWNVVTNGDTSMMCKYLLNECEEGASDHKSKEQCMKQVEMVIPCLHKKLERMKMYQY